MSDERKTSYAKDVELTSYQKTALDRAEAIRERYNSASRGNLSRFNAASGADNAQQ